MPTPSQIPSDPDFFLDKSPGGPGIGGKFVPPGAGSGGGLGGAGGGAGGMFLPQFLHGQTGFDPFLQFRKRLQGAFGGIGMPQSQTFQPMMGQGMDMGSLMGILQMLGRGM